MHFSNFADTEGRSKSKNGSSWRMKIRFRRSSTLRRIHLPSRTCGIMQHGLRPHRLQRGKAIRGPHVRVCCRQKRSGRLPLLNNSPHEDTLGAVRKWGKRKSSGCEGAGILLKEDHEALNKEWQRRLDFISGQVKDSWRDNFVPARKSRTCPPHAHQVGCGAHCVTPREAALLCAAQRRHRSFIGEHGEPCR